MPATKSRTTIAPGTTVRILDGPHAGIVGILIGRDQHGCIVGVDGGPHGEHGIFPADTVEACHA